MCVIHLNGRFSLEAAVLIASLLMGLDTVELIVSFEKYFELTIPDRVAERIGTVEEVAEWVGQQLGTTAQWNSEVRATVARQLREVLVIGHIAEATPLMQFMEGYAVMRMSERRQAQAHYAELLAAATGLRLPELHFSTAPQSRGWWHRLFSLPLETPKTAPATHTLADLIDWTVALNYAQLLRSPFVSQYDVERAVIGITSDKSGVEVSDIRLDSSFTNDLGMD